MGLGRKTMEFPDGTSMIVSFPLTDDGGWSPGSLRIILGQVIVGDQYHIKKNLQANSVVLDIGASVGAFSWLCSTLGAEVYAFEPNPAEFHALDAMVKNNDVNVVAIQKAVSDEDGGMIPFFTGFEGAVGDGEVTGGVGDADIMVERTTIDAFMSANEISRIDLIKIDTEGHERQVLRGAAKMIEEHHPVLLVSEYHRPNDPDVLSAEILSIRNDYTVHHIQKDCDFAEKILLMVPGHLDGAWKPPSY